MWECPEPDCEDFWVDSDRLDPGDPPLCPNRDCHPVGARDAVRYAGFTWGEAVDASNRFNCDVRVHYSQPVPELVQLSTIEGEWIGLPVFHPSCQKGVSCDWHSYDVGVVVEVFPDPHFEGETRVRFQGACGDGGWTLQYSARNLWVPKRLADLLSKVP